jgi:outer membrane protein TolC
VRFGLRFVIPLLAAGAAAAQSPVVVPPLQEVEVQPRAGALSETRITLDEVIRRVLEANTDLSVARINREEAGHAVRAARGAFDPVIGLQAFGARTVTPAASVLEGGSNGRVTARSWNATPSLSGLLPALGGSYQLAFDNARQTTDNTFSTLNPRYATALRLALNQPLWRGLRFDENRHRIAVASKNRELSTEQLRQRVTDVVTQAIEAYWELAYAYQNYQVQSEAVQLAERQYGSNRRQAEQGVLAPVDVVAAQTQVATYQQAVFAAQQALTAAENNLKILMLPNREDPLWNAALVPEAEWKSDGDVPELAKAIQQALASRPELAESELAIAANQLDIRLAREQAKPRIDLVASAAAAGLSGRPLVSSNPLTGGFAPMISLLNQLAILNNLPPVTSLSFGSSEVPKLFVGGYGQSLGNLYSGSFPTVQVGAQVQLPLRNRTAEAQHAIAAAEGKRLRTIREQARMLVEREVRNSLQAVTATRSRLEAAGVARRSADEQYASEQRQFQAGTSTVFLVFQRQSELIAARSREVRARADAAEAAAALDRAIARTIDVRRIQVNAP